MASMDDTGVAAVDGQEDVIVNADLDLAAFRPVRIVHKLSPAGLLQGAAPRR